MEKEKDCPCGGMLIYSHPNGNQEKHDDGEHSGNENKVGRVPGTLVLHPRPVLRVMQKVGQGMETEATSVYAVDENAREETDHRPEQQVAGVMYAYVSPRVASDKGP